MLVDMHCHLDLYPNPTVIAEKCANKDLFILSVTTTPKAWSGTKALEKGYGNIITALGFHPQLVHERATEIGLFERLFSETQYIGEIGLDCSKGYKEYIEPQLRVFRRILCLVREVGGKVLSIHSRGCADLVLKELNGGEGLPILHWFSGTKDQLSEAIDKGCWFSVGPEQLNTQKGKDLLKLIPRNRVLTETDGPFASMGNRAIAPWDVRAAITQMGASWACSDDEAMDQVSHNLRDLQARQTH